MRYCAAIPGFSTVLRRVQFVEHRRPPELVERTLQSEARPRGSLDEGDDALDETVREPRVGGRAFLAGRLVQEAPGAFLRRRRATVEVDRVRGAFDGFGVDVHAHGGALLERAGVAVHRDDGVGVLVAGLGAVVAALEGLEGMYEAGIPHAWRRMRLDTLEHPGAFQSEDFAFGLVGALDREAAEALAPAVCDVEAENHYMRAGDRVHGQAVPTLAISHGSSHAMMECIK